MLNGLLSHAGKPTSPTRHRRGVASPKATSEVVYEAQAHSGVGGAGGGGTAACSGDLLLGALAACAQLTCQMVATALGVDKGVPAGFEDIRVSFDIQAPEASAEQLASLGEKTERYCTVFQTLVQPPPTRTEWRAG